jgi:D-sedoheptulose 7-phosphate isomerase
MSRLEITDLHGHGLGTESGFMRLCELSKNIQSAGLTQYFIGNGASAAFASHMALDWTKNGQVPSHAFSDHALMTALANDLGADEIFSAPLSWHATRGDLLIAISSSGNSPNIVRAIEEARSIGMTIVTITGLKLDNASRKLGDVNLFLPAHTYGIVESVHQVLLHVWLDMFMGIKEWEKTSPQNMRASEFQL